MERVVCLAIGYVFGMFQTAFIYGKMNGIDIREHGSGNSGTTNALRVLGKKAGAIVLFGDVMKTVLAILLARFLYRSMGPEMMKLLSLYAGAGAILGHNFPFYLNFKGGKGIAATAGLITAFDWRFFIICAIAFFTAFFITHYVSLGSLLVYFFFVVTMFALGQMGVLGVTEQTHLYEMYALSLFLAAMAYIKHAPNIKRLLQGTERKTYLTKKSGEEV
ncbi:MAG: glycerol-3-phosphate 1-O-acyltransferase PlsY [Lachnospiraceae bacterium]|nr:glycerol-3-phosphate 1-O-acyltransferase PlsY [Lachnospiraceae bacterium]